MSSEHTISKALDQRRLRTRLDSLMIDNTGIAQRPGYRELVMHVIPEVRKAFRLSKDIPAELIPIETKYLERVMWPRSRYQYNVLKEQIERFTDVDVGRIYVPEVIDYFNGIAHPFKPSSEYTFKPELDRNKRALRKAAGLPTFGKKGEALAGSSQYNAQVVKPKPVLRNCYSVLPGYRTQQSSLEEPKVRLVWSIPCHVWQLECEALDSAIDNSIAAWSEKCPIVHFYTDPMNIQKWFKFHSSKVSQYISLDSSAYDSTVQAPELAFVWNMLSPKYEFKDLLASYTAYADIVMPEGIVSRTGGMPSGSKVTNIGDGITNVHDFCEVLYRLNLLKYLVAILVNGDDITLALSTRLTADNIGKFAKFTRRNISPDKSVVMTGAAWNSKWYISDELMTRPIFRAINSLMFKEHQSDPITGGKEYVAIARVQIMRDVEQHPLFDVLAKQIAKYEEFTWSEIKGSPRFKVALEKYVEDHDYTGNTTSQSVLAALEDTRYIKEFAK